MTMKWNWWAPILNLVCEVTNRQGTFRGAISLGIRQFKHFGEFHKLLLLFDPVPTFFLSAVAFFYVFFCIDCFCIRVFFFF